MGDNHIITHRLRQRHEADNLLNDNELNRFREKDD